MRHLPLLLLRLLLSLLLSLLVLVLELVLLLLLLLLLLVQLFMHLPSLSLSLNWLHEIKLPVLLPLLLQVLVVNLSWTLQIIHQCARDWQRGPIFAPSLWGKTTAVVCGCWRTCQLSKRVAAAVVCV